MSWLLPPLTPHFHAALRDVDAKAPDARVRAAMRLGTADEAQRPDALRALTVLSADVNAQVRSAALAGLGELADSSSLDTLISGLDDAFSEVREMAVVALGQLGGPRAQQAVVDALDSEAAEVRFQAVAALCEIAPAVARSELVSLIDDPDALVRGQVAECLGRIGERQTLGHLARLLDDEAPDVRLAAAVSLAGLDDPRGEDELIVALQAGYRVFDVCEALGCIATDKGQAALAERCGRFLTSSVERAAAAAALVARDDERGVAGLRRVLTGWPSAGRTFAVEMVGRHGCVALVAELCQLARRPRGADTTALRESLVALAAASPEAREGLETLARRGDADGAAARAWLADRQLQNHE